MKKFNRIAVLVVAALVIFSGCASSGVTRVDPYEDVELDGYWSDTDVRIVCEDIIGQIIASDSVVRAAKRLGRTPIVVIGNIRNISDEYINTDIVADKMKAAIIKSGKLRFLANKDYREDLRQEISDQADYANPDQAKEFANENAADYMLSGSIDTMSQQDGKKSLRTYYVTIELNDIETHETVGIFQPAPENQPRKMFTKKR